jgi:very-short-patch-repair endonuclease
LAAERTAAQNARDRLRNGGATIGSALVPGPTPWGAAGEFAASRHGVTTRAQAATFGVTKHVVSRLIRQQILTEPVPGVLVVVGSPCTWRQRLTVATCAANSSAVAGYRSAAALHGMDGYDEGPLEVVATAWRRIEIDGLVLHTGPLDGDVLDIDGIRCTSIARTLCDLGSVDPVNRVRMAFEWAWRSGVSLAWLQTTVDRLHRPGQRGTGVLQQLLIEARRCGRPTESALEVELEQALRGLAGLVRQHDIRNADGEVIARADFAVPDAMVAIEAHSRRHHFGPDALLRDAARDRAMQAQGWVVRYVTKRHLANPAAVRLSIVGLVAERRRAGLRPTG